MWILVPSRKRVARLFACGHGVCGRRRHGISMPRCGCANGRWRLTVMHPSFVCRVTQSESQTQTRTARSDARPVTAVCTCVLSAWYPCTPRCRGFFAASRLPAGRRGANIRFSFTRYFRAPARARYRFTTLRHTNMSVAPRSAHLVRHSHTPPELRSSLAPRASVCACRAPPARRPPIPPTHPPESNSPLDQHLPTPAPAEGGPRPRDALDVAQGQKPSSWSASGRTGLRGSGVRACATCSPRRSHLERLRRRAHRASRYCVSSPTRYISRDSSTADTKARSSPVSRGDGARAAREDDHAGDHLVGRQPPRLLRQRASQPKPMFSSVIEPPGRNSASGGVATAYCSPRSCSGSFTEFEREGLGARAAVAGRRGRPGSRAPPASRTSRTSPGSACAMLVSSPSAIEIIFFISRERMTVGRTGPRR